MLYPFTPTTDADLAADLLLQHVSYHVQLGFAKVIQYTQARPCRRLERGGTGLGVLGPHAAELVQARAGSARTTLAPAEPILPLVRLCNRLWHLMAVQSWHL